MIQFPSFAKFAALSIPRFFISEGKMNEHQPALFDAAAVNGTTDATRVWDTQGPQPVRVNETGATAHRWFEDPQSALGTAALEVSSTGIATWLVSDFQGSITGTIKTAGLTGTAKYGAFGEPITSTGSMASQPLQFQGQYNDTITGLYDMRMRDYNPATGGFTNTDPVTAKPGTPFASTYNFAYNQPTTLSDPSGACPWCIFIIVVGVSALINGAIAQSEGRNVPMAVAEGAVVGALSFVGGPVLGTAGRVALGAAAKALPHMGRVGAGISQAATAASRATATATAAAAQAAAVSRAWLKKYVTGPLDAAARKLYECAAGRVTPGTTTAAASTDDLARIAQATVGDSGVAVRFGEGSNSVNHAFRHVQKYGLDPADVASVVRSDVDTVAQGLAIRTQYTGTVVVEGRTLRYSAWKLEDGLINIGRISD